MSEVMAKATPRSGAAGKSDSEQLVDILMAAGVVDRHMMERAEAIHHSQGRWLGGILVELGAISPDDMAKAIATALDLKVANLQQATFNADAMRLLPESMARRFNALPLSYIDGRLAVAMVNPLDTLACDLIQARTGARVDRMVTTEREVRAAHDRFYTQLAREAASPATASTKKAGSQEPEEIEIIDIDELLRMMMERKASDLHLSANSAPTMRIDGELVPVTSQKLGPKQVHELVYAILTDEQIYDFEQNWELDFAYSIAGLSRFRVNVHRQRGLPGRARRSPLS